ncbi:MAG: HAD family hydrolase [Anaerolineae bacterium]|nr:HAD family hydrolase [Anaerolineae bacterium]
MNENARHLCHIPFDQVRAWLFDLDGTLMDTDDQSVAVLARRLRFLGAARAQQLARRLIMFSETPSNAALTFLDVLHLDSAAFALEKRFTHARHGYSFKIIEGTTPMLTQLGRRYPLAVVSTRGAAAAEAFLAQHNLTPLFPVVVTRETTRRLKPHPAPVQYAAQALGLKPEECVMVGDTTVDIVSARRAGAWAIGVLCGFGEEKELWRAGAHLVLPSTADLLAIQALFPEAPAQA